MFKKKKKKKPEPDLNEMPVLPNDLAEHAQSLAGMSSDEIVKLLESLGRIDESITVTRRRGVPGKNSSKEVGGKTRIMSIEEAVEYEKHRSEERAEKERQIKELHHLEAGVLDRDEINDEIYPKRLTPKDIAQSIESAKERLAEQDRLRENRVKVFSPKEEILLHVLELVKKHEASRVARIVSEKQRSSVIGKTIEQLEEERKARIRKLKGEPDPIDETPEEQAAREQREEEEKQEMIRNLPSFDKNIKTLTDEAGELTQDNIDAATAVVRQWIGNQILTPGAEQ